MARGRLEQQLASLETLRTGGTGAETERALKKALGDRNNYYVSKAAAAVEHLGLKQLIPDLLAAYTRFSEQNDPQCWAKNALIKALGELGHDDPEPYLRGLTHIQMEPVFGGRVDTAGTLRASCAIALVGCRTLPSTDLLRHLVPLLLDPEKTVRIEAARAIAHLGRDEGSLLLRLRALQGDDEPEVLGAVFSSIIALERLRGVEFVAGFIQAGSESAAEAALSLGESRTLEALEILKNRLEDADFRSLRRTLLASIALTRLAEGTEYLMNIIRRDAPGAPDARQALLDYGALSDADRQALQSSSYR